MSPDERKEKLMPFNLTSILKEQLMNLVEENTGNINIILKQSNRGIPKDKVSAFMYGLYYVKKDEELKRKRRKRNISDFMLFS